MGYIKQIVMQKQGTPLTMHRYLNRYITDMLKIQI